MDKLKQRQVETGDLVFYAPATGSFRARNIIRVVSEYPLIRIYKNPQAMIMNRGYLLTFTIQY
jgi:hypothetical protein